MIKEYLLLSGHSNSVGDVWPCVNFFTTGIFRDHSGERYTVYVPVRTPKEMGTYPMSRVVYVFILLVLVLVGQQNVMIFNNQDLNSFYLSKTSGTGL